MYNNQWNITERRKWQLRKNILGCYKRKMSTKEKVKTMKQCIRNVLNAVLYVEAIRHLRWWCMNPKHRKNFLIIEKKDDFQRCRQNSTAIMAVRNYFWRWARVVSICNFSIMSTIIPLIMVMIIGGILGWWKWNSHDHTISCNKKIQWWISCETWMGLYFFICYGYCYLYCADNIL